jgi:hypothetical protein
MPWIIAAAVAASTIYSSNEQRKAAKSAQEQANRAAQSAQTQAENQLAIQKEQAAIAKTRLDAEVAKNAEEKARLEAAAKQQSDSLEAERRDLAEKEAGRMRAVRRSGRRSLMSDVRLAPETGIMTGNDINMATLGTGGVTIQ